MRIFTSYFYQIRFFNKDTYPFSTAMWDPKWFHDFKGEDYVFQHSDGVIYGMKYYPFVPGPTCDGECHGREGCPTGDPSKCDFLRHYREQLDKLDVNTVLKEIEDIVGPDADVCFIFHEAWDNPCSERRVVQEWFKDNGVEIKEWGMEVYDGRVVE